MTTIHKYGLAIIFVLGLLTIGFSQAGDCDLLINGLVLDLETNEPLPYATVAVTELGQGVATDQEGRFTLESICDEEIHLEISFVGYKTVIHHHDFHHGDPTILLAADNTQLDGIVVEGSRLNTFQSLTIQSLEVNRMQLLSSSVADLTEKISGVSILKTGNNIAKPIIHGLHSNRVLVMNDGLRHSYQVWGAGHAPEIDPSHINDIEVVKGAGTVKYGPEALGGVILYNSKRPILDQSLTGSAGTSYETNGHSSSGQLSFEHGTHRFAWNMNAFGIRQGDLQAPDYNLSNTGKREYGGSFNTLYHQPKFELQLSGSYLDQELGILRGSLVGNLDDLQNAIERSIPNPTFEPTFEIQNPKHQTRHGLLKSNLSLYLGEHIIKVQYGVQRNIRKEFDVRRGELNDRPVIDLELLSHSFESEWIQPDVGNWSGSTGVQMFTQRSVNEPGSNPINFVPNYDVFNIGTYSIQTLTLDDWTMELGGRFDYQTLSVRDTIRDVAFYANEVSFSNATFTLGVRRDLSQEVSFYSNIGSAWRPPNVAELYSFGYHFSRIQFGLWRYMLNPQISTPLNSVFDQSDREVPSERSLKWVSGINVRNERFNAEFIFYINRIKNYIFLRPFGITTNVAGTFPYFIFDQTDALFLGSDWDIQYHHNERFTSEFKISYVYAQEIVNDQPFIEIPPLNMNYSLDYESGPWGAGIGIDYMAQQWRAPQVIEPSSFNRNDSELMSEDIFDFMEAPSAFVLLGAQVSYQYQSLTLQAKADNILNTSYRSYTDRLRYFGDAPGRSFSLSIDVSF